MRHAHKIIELAAEDRSTIERLLGRTLGADEAVEIIACVISELTDVEAIERSRAVVRILELAKVKQVGGLSARDLIKTA